MDQMRRKFRPEFLNRLDEYIIFSGLSLSDLRIIVTQQVKLLNKRLVDKRINVRCTDEALNFLAEIGYDPIYGARPLQRAVRKELETPMARELLAGTFQDGSDILVNVVNDRLILTHDDDKSSPPTAAISSAPPASSASSSWKIEDLPSQSVSPSSPSEPPALS